MDRVKSLFGSCIHPRKRSKPQYHDSWLAPGAPAASCTHHAAAQQPTEPKGLAKTSSIRIVESDPDEESDDGPERRFRLSRFSVADPDEYVEEDLEEDISVSDDHTNSKDDPTALPQPHSWTRTTHALTTEIKPRRIEDIPEEDEGDDRPSDKDADMPTQEEQVKPRRRKSLVEIVQLLQATAAGIKGIAPSVPDKSPLRGTAATSSTSLPSLASSLSTDDTDSDDEVKRQRRVGAIVFPAVMRLRGAADAGKKRPVSVTAGVTMGKERKGVFC